MADESLRLEVRSQLEAMVRNQAAMWASPKFVDVIKATKMTSDDVLIAGFMKTGTNLLQQICHQIRMGGVGDEDFDEIWDMVPTLMMSSVFIKRDLNAPQRGDFKIFKTHQRPHELPEAGVEQSKVIWVIRDPVNSAASGLQWAPTFVNINPAGFDPMDGYKNLFANEKAFFHYWLFMADWLRLYKNGAKNILPVFYEDLVRDPPVHIRRIANFIGKPLTEDQLQKVVQLSSFEYMKANEHKFSLRKERELVGRAKAQRDGTEYQPVVAAPFVNKGAKRDGKKELPQEVLDDMKTQWANCIEKEFGYSSYDDMREDIWSYELLI